MLWGSKPKKKNVDHERYAELVAPHIDAAYNFAYRLCGDRNNANDVTQEALLRGLQYFHSFEGTNARFWLLGIVRNSFYDWSTKQKAHHAVHDEFEEDIHTFASSAPDESHSDPEAHLLRLRMAGLIDQALNRLPLVFREVVILRDIEDFSYKEIAQLLDIPVGTVMSRLARGRQELCSLLKDMKPKA